MNDYLDYEEDPVDFDEDFADPGGNSSLRAATKNNPRNISCPTCKQPNRLTQRDVDLCYHCNQCADQLEKGW